MTYKEALLRKLTAFADDELMLAQRNSEWVGHAPLLEEDIALANISQDELGHATLFYGLIQSLTGVKADDLVFQRNAADFRSSQFLELPRGDWAFTMVRQYLFDAYEALLYNGLSQSYYQPLADAATKMLREDKFHLQHSALWLERLGLGSSEANARAQAALNQLWPYAFQLFESNDDDTLLLKEKVIPNFKELEHDWLELIKPQITKAELTLPSAERLKVSRGQHHVVFNDLISDLQSVARTVPAEVW